MPHSYLLFLICRIARQIYYFHSVIQRTRYHGYVVCSCYKHNGRQIKVDIQIVILERIVYLRVKNLQHRGGRIAAHIVRKLIYLIQQEERIHRARLLYTCNYAPGYRADVRPSVAAYLGFIFNSAKAHAHELSAYCLGNRACYRRFAHSGRPCETENRPFHIILELAHGEVFYHALLNLLHAIMIFIQYFFNVIEIYFLFRIFSERQAYHCFKIRPRDIVFRRLIVHASQSGDFCVQLFACFFADGQIFDLLRYLHDLFFKICIHAQARLDRTHLLSEVHFTLLLFYLCTCAV